jgi:hypothetical protein
MEAFFFYYEGRVLGCEFASFCRELLVIVKHLRVSHTKKAGDAKQPEMPQRQHARMRKRQPPPGKSALLLKVMARLG